MWCASSHPTNFGTFDDRSPALERHRGTPELCGVRDVVAFGVTNHPFPCHLGDAMGFKMNGKQTTPTGRKHPGRHLDVHGNGSFSFNHVVRTGLVRMGLESLSP